MNYLSIIKGHFIDRPNRFIARIQVNDHLISAHVKNTGRCRELLLPGAEVILQYHPDSEALGRKTAYSLIGVYKVLETGVRILINMDSQAPNQVAFEWLLTFPEISRLRREVKFGQSRFDLAFEAEGKPGFMEVKGVTLENEGTARFPDAPTERGVKHLHELVHAARDGYAACVLFVIQMKGVHKFQPNTDTHPEFAAALREAAQAGVKILAYDCLVTEASLCIDEPVPVELSPQTV